MKRQYDISPRAPTFICSLADQVYINQILTQPKTNITYSSVNLNKVEAQAILTFITER